MPFLHVGMSIGTIWTASVLLLHLVYLTSKGKSLPEILVPIKSNLPALLLFFFFIFHLVALLWTDDFGYAYNDIRIKLPLLVFALACGILPPLSSKELRTLAISFAVSCTLALIYSTYKLHYDPMHEGVDRNAAGIFISHIRFGLMSAMAVGIWLWLWQQRVMRFVPLVMPVISIICQWQLGMMTGLVMSAVAIVLFVLFVNKYLRIAIIGASLAALAFVLFLANEHFTPKEKFLSEKRFSENGEPYHANPSNKQLENGYYVWNHIAYNELETHWMKVAGISLDSLDGRGNPLRSTLIRYITSLGLPKDSTGIAQLSPGQIQEVKSGIASPETERKTGFEKRLSEIFFELNAYQNGANPCGNSLTQRLEFQKAALAIATDNPLIGVGTGDVKISFEKYYAKIDSQLDFKYRLRAHQQFLTIWIAFGAFGLLLFTMMLWYAPLRNRTLFYYLPLTFIVISSLSFLSEDTLETQAGATFFGWFYGLLIIAGQLIFGQQTGD